MPLNVFFFPFAAAAPVTSTTPISPGAFKGVAQKLFLATVAIQNELINEPKSSAMLKTLQKNKNKTFPKEGERARRRSNRSNLNCESPT